MSKLQVIEYNPKGFKFYYQGVAYVPLVDPHMLEPLDRFLEWSATFGYRKIDTLGVYCRRRISGSWRWSAHSWCKAIDIIGVWDNRVMARGLKYSNPDDRRLMAGALKHAGFTVHHQDDCKGKYNHLHAQVQYNSLIIPPTKMEVIK